MNITDICTLKPFKYQLVGANFLINRKYALLADSMGLGKTITAAIAAIYASQSLSEEGEFGTIAVICPAFLVDTWKRELDTKFPHYRHRFYIGSYNYFSTRYKDLEHHDIWVIDEIHYLKNKKAKRTNNIIAAAAKYKPKYVFGLSGTPIKNRIPEFYTLLYLMFLNRPGEFNFSYTKFCETFSHAELKTFNGVSVMNYTGHKNLDVLKKQYLKKVYLRRTLEDIDHKLPPLFRKEVYIESKDTQTKLKEAWENYQANKDTASFATLKMENAINKVEATIKYIEGLLDEDPELPLIIFSDHVKSAELIFLKFMSKGIACGTIDGRTSMEVRDIVVRGFNEGRYQLLMLTIGAASVGYTLVRGSHIIFNDLPWVSTDLDQAEKRIHRIGQSKTCYIHFISYGRVDSYINNKLMFKRDLLEEVL